MSLQPATRSPQAAAKRDLFKLQNAGQHAQWKSNLQDYMFDKFHDVNMDKITSGFTLDIDFFAKHSDFKDDCKVHSRDGDNKMVNPFAHCPAYGVECFDHAIKTGDGFKPWLYTTFSYVRAALSDTIQRQTGRFIYFDPGAVLDAFFGEISYRMQGEYRGAAISPFTALQTQFERYYFAVLNWHAAAGFLKFTGTWGWLLAASLAAWAVLRDRSFVPLSDFAVFVLIGLVVIGRYLVMANHSQIHTIFVHRYLFLFLTMAWAAAIWSAWTVFDRRDGRTG